MQIRISQFVFIISIISLGIYSASCSSSAYDTSHVALGTEANPFKVFDFQTLACVGSAGKEQNGEDCSAYSEWMLSSHYKMILPIDAGKTCKANYDYNGATLIESDCTSGSTWEYIGSDTEKFTGTFDAFGYKIWNLYINSVPSTYNGFFGYISGATIKNMFLEVIRVNGSIFVGGIAGYAEENSHITNSFIRGNITGFSNVGGFVGKLSNSSITSSSVASTVIAQWSNAGGIVGYMDSGSHIENNSVTANVMTNNSSGVGGIVGYIFGNGNVIKNSYTTGDVMAGLNVAGGIAGYIAGTQNVITSSYTTGNITARSDVGGLAGMVLNENSISNSYAAGDVNATDDTAGGLVGVLSGQSSISNSYAIGDVNATADIAGGLVGRMSGQSNINNSYAGGNLISNGSNMGALVAFIVLSSNTTITGVNYYVNGSAMLAGSLCTMITCVQQTLNWLQDSLSESAADGAVPAGLVWDSNTWGNLDMVGSFPCLKRVTPSCD